MLDFRQNGIIAVTGQTGVGKSHHNDIMLQQYVLDNSQTLKRGRKAIILDVKGDEAYSKYPVIGWTKIKNQPDRTIYRLTPFDPRGNPLPPDELTERYYYLMDVYRGGAILLEDWNTYGLDTKNTKALGPLTTARHNGCDIIFSMQNMNKITREIWENISLYRFHKQLTSIDSQRKDIDDFEMLKIAEIIVNEQFNIISFYRKLRRIDEKTYKKFASFYLWVDFRRKVVEGCSREKFIQAAVKMIQADQYNFFMHCKFHQLDHRKPDQYNEAIKLKLKEYLRFYSDMSQ